VIETGPQPHDEERGMASIAITPRRVQLVKQSFAKVVPIGDQAASLFYGRLFEIAPEVRPLFRDDITAQGRKLISVLALAVGSLQKLPELVPSVQDLGRRHTGYGVRDEHYDLVAEALMWALDKGLGPDFTPEVKDAWIAVYTTLADTMKGAAQQIAA
jgi:hemoglobin-like flavoprotein